MALPIFAITIFVSAFLLFLVQPLIGKLILPKLGGTPQVWNTCMVFFQSVLLLGYAYTHSVTTRLKLRQQLMLHGALLFVPIVIMLVFPIYTTVIGDKDTPGWTPPAGANPILNTLGLLAMIVGIPFFVVSTSAPLLQKWFSYSGHTTAKDPYFLYSVSNLGSLLSLFFYPAILEPTTFLRDQTNIWFGGYILLAALVLYCAYTIFKLAPSDDQIFATESAASAEAPPAPAPETPAAAPVPAAASTALKSGPAPGGIQRKKGAKVLGKPDLTTPNISEPSAPLISHGATAEMTWWRRIRWVLLAAVSSSMMMGVTSYISTDLSPFVLLWIIPLALYLLSFIVVYERALKWTGKRYQIFGPPGYTLHQIMVYVAQPLGILAMAYIILTRQHDPVIAIFFLMFGFFANALACHGELAVDRPSTRNLTEYFLLMSFGGMVGGIFNAIVAPLVFTNILEFYIVIVVACLVRPQYVASGWFDELILSAFPGLQNWFRNQGDEMAKSMGYSPPRTTYLFSIILDVIFGAFILSIAYWLKTTPMVGSFIKSMKFSDSMAPAIFRLAIFGVPMIFCFFFAGRPLRMTLAVGGLLLGSMWLGASEDRDILESRRTYFGVLRVEQEREYPRDEEEKVYFRREPIKIDGEMRLPPFSFTFLMHGTTYHGRNYRYIEKDNVDLSRLATTYYHRYGPVGWVMERDNWFKGKQNTYHSDVRLPAALVGDILGSAGTGFNPMLTALTECWSEPPFGTIGLGTGTMASYARPFQHMTYYEIDDVIREFSLPEGGADAHFTFLQGAIRRGVNLEVIMGDARLSLEPKREKDNLKNAFVYQGDFSKMNTKAAGARAYANAPYKEMTRDTIGAKGDTPKRDGYFKVINVDAFSSDAIPIHLVTKEAIEIYMTKLRDDGVLCVHTSNRHMDLVRPVARIALELSKEAKKRGEPEILCLVGKDAGQRGSTSYLGHFGSEYVMIFRDTKTSSDPEVQKIQHFGEYQKELEAKKAEFIKNFAERKDDGQAQKLTMRQDGAAPEGWQILNSPVEWYNPYTDHTKVVGPRGNRRLAKDPITDRDSLWTDDYSHILGAVRWHFPWD